MIAEYTNYEGITEWDVTNQMGRKKKLDVSRLSKLGWEAKTHLKWG